ncbi:hypothetical protein [Synechococcus elongatus]|uniref:hypothetical protein n=1 Tax=Synechococcus elongatus TaxID=32046 RepID=UPI000F7E6180|nr:hypothetical protein [Synechococcus elongatus]
MPKPAPQEESTAELIPVVDRWLRSLSPSDHESFFNFAKATFSIVEIFLYARFNRYEGTIVDLEKWINRRFRKLNKQKVLMDEIENIKADVEWVRGLLENGEVRFDIGMSRLTMLQKELRGHIESSEKIAKGLDRRTLLLTGADRVLREMEATFGDDPHVAPALESVSQAVWARLTMEV